MGGIEWSVAAGVRFRHRTVREWTPAQAPVFIGDFLLTFCCRGRLMTPYARIITISLILICPSLE